MRRWFTLLAGVLLVAACGGGSSTPKATSNASGGSTSSSSSSNGSGTSVDCAQLKNDLVTLGFPGVQILAQIHSQQVIDDIRSKQGVASTFDLDEFTAAVGRLHALDRFDAPPFGSPKASLDLYGAAAAQLKTMVDSGAAVSQGDLDKYSQDFPAATLISKQAAVTAASEAAGCK